MWMELGARFHAFVNSFGQSSEAEQTRALYEEVEALLDTRGVTNSEGRQVLCGMIAVDVVKEFGLDQGHSQYTVIESFTCSLFGYEELFILPDLDRSSLASLTVAEHWELRNALIRQRDWAKHYEPSRIYRRV